jgi:hypothetical protein
MLDVHVKKNGINLKVCWSKWLENNYFFSLKSIRIISHHEIITDKFLQFSFDHFYDSRLNFSEYSITRVIGNRVSSIEYRAKNNYPGTRVPGLENDIPNPVLVIK